MNKFIVVGDLGGTNCRFELLLVSAESYNLRSKPEPIYCAKYRSSSSPSLLALIERFVNEPNFKVAMTSVRTAASCVQLYSISICGAVHCGRATLLAASFGEQGWVVDSRELSDVLGTPVLLLNDFHAVGLSLKDIKKEDIHELYISPAGTGVPSNGVVACLGPGTGLGEVYTVRQEDPSQFQSRSNTAVVNTIALSDTNTVTITSNLTRVCCSEGGMSDFVARTQREWELRQFIARKDGTSFVEVEKVVSGTGIMNAYLWLRDQLSDEEKTNRCRPGSVDAAIMSAEEPAGVIALNCNPIGIDAPNAHIHGSEGDPLCAAAIDMFLTALGAEAGNMAIRYQAKGGVYIAGGGIPRKLAAHILDGRVARAYLDKGHSVASYDCCPLYLVTTCGDDLGLSGAFQFALTHIHA